MHQGDLLALQKSRQSQRAVPIEPRLSTQHFDLKSFRAQFLAECAQVVDERGLVVIKPEYDQAASFSNGLARVNVGGRVVNERQLLDIVISYRGGRYGYVDRNGQLVIPCQFLEAGHFSKRGAEVTLEDGSQWLIDRHGGRITQLESDPVNGEK